MPTGLVAIKGSDDDIKAFETLILQINTIYKGIYPSVESEKFAKLMECLHDTSEENTMLRTFLKNIVDAFKDGENNSLWEFADHDFHYNASERELNIGGHILGDFRTDEWADALSNTFPNLSFFIGGDYLNDYIRGHYWKIYKNGVYVDGEYRVYDVEGIECPEEEDDEEDYDGWCDNLLDDIEECTLELANAELLAWKLSDSDEELFKHAKANAEVAREKLKSVLDRAGLS
jgi:hypothetical protein